jgi:hypothetical protein
MTEKFSPTPKENGPDLQNVHRIEELEGMLREVNDPDREKQIKERLIEILKIQIRALKGGFRPEPGKDIDAETKNIYDDDQNWVRKIREDLSALETRLQELEKAPKSNSEAEPRQA